MRAQGLGWGVTLNPLCCAVLVQALSWTFYLLLQHPEVEQKLLAEIQQVLGPQQPAGSKDSSKAAADAAGADSSGSPGVLRPSYDQLRQLRYARAVFMEALRLYPSVPEVSGVVADCVMLPLAAQAAGCARCRKSGSMLQRRYMPGTHQDLYRHDRLPLPSSCV